jgi:eukaryotic-like serine/threonine-protein kinase
VLSNIAGEGMNSDSFEDADVRLFREEYPDIYEFVVKVIYGTYDERALLQFEYEYGKELLAEFMRFLTGTASSEEIKTFEEEYPDVYLAINKILRQRAYKESAGGWRKHEDEYIRYLRQDVPDVYGFVLQQIDGIYDETAIKKLLDDYGDVFCDDLMKVIHGHEDREVIKRFKEEYQEDVYVAVKKMIAACPSVKAAPAVTVYFKKGDIIGKNYEVIDVLGEGGFGIVYHVYSHETKNTYALKTFRAEYFNDLRTRLRFRKEAQIWINLGRHPYLVRAHFIVEICGQLYIAMEYIAPDEDGVNTLDAYLRSKPPDLEQALRWATQFCHGMEYAHARGINAHRDIKPTNIMIGIDKFIRIADFGLAGVINAPNTAKIETSIKSYGAGGYKTVAGTAFGTPPYMPPEQFINAANCDERSDIYSFGIVLYQMASGGILPFYPNVYDKGGGGSFQAWYQQHCEAIIPKLNSPIFSIISRCLEKKAINRYSSFEELRKHCEALLEKETGKVVLRPESKELAAWEWSNKGGSLYTLGKLREAIFCFDKALAIDPICESAWYNKALALESLGHDQEAISCFEKALERRPESIEAWHKKGFLLRKLAHYQEAIGCYEKILELNPSDGDAWNYKGIVLGKLGKYKQALLCFDGALEIDSRDANAWYNKGIAFQYSKRYQEAINCYEQALKIKPLHGHSWYEKAIAQEHLGLNAMAVSSYKRFIELAQEQNTEQVEYARQRLRKLQVEYVHEQLKKLGNIKKLNKGH